MSFDRGGSPQVYFLRQVGGIGAIKIGHSFHPKARLGSYCNWSPVPLEIILMIDGPKALERNIHDCFADCHSHREWFHPEPRLLAAIEAMRAGAPVGEAIDLSKRIGSVRAFKLADAAERRGTSQETYAL